MHDHSNYLECICKFYRLAESSKKGYDLAQADDCSEAPYSERELPTADFIAMRLIMHALLTWTVCSDKVSLNKLSST